MLARFPAAIGLTIAMTAALYCASWLPLPFASFVRRAEPGNPPGWVRPFEISLFKGELWFYGYEWSGMGRPPYTGIRFYSFPGERPSRRAWITNSDSLRFVVSGAGIELARLP